MIWTVCPFFLILRKAQQLIGLFTQKAFLYCCIVSHINHVAVDIMKINDTVEFPHIQHLIINTTIFLLLCGEL